MTSPEFCDEETYYGKNNVPVLRVTKQGNVHYIKELVVSTHLSLDTKKDYESGDNSSVIPTDTQKNTVYALAKTKGITSAEQFGLDLCRHYLVSYPWVTRAQAHVSEACGWHRMDQQGKEHVHAFVSRLEGTHFCSVDQTRGEQAKVSSGIKDLRILKTTKSGFEKFNKDDYTTLPETKDRLCSTVVYSKWSYNDVRGVDFDRVWEVAKYVILDEFAGSPDTGMYSPSVQKTLYQSMRKIMQKVPQIRNITMEMPNVHYFSADLAKLGLTNNNEVYVPSVNPHGLIRATIQRPKSKL